MYVPGVIQHIAMNQYYKDQIALVYRVINEKGQMSRVRIINQIDCNIQTDFE